MQMKKVSGAQVKHFSRAEARSRSFATHARWTRTHIATTLEKVETIPDGDYDVLVVDVEAGEGETHSPRIDLVIVSGERKGEVVSVRAGGLARDTTEILGLPATLRVASGVPHLVLDDSV
jgi:hypothetical protein